MSKQDERVTIHIDPAQKGGYMLYVSNPYISKHFRFLGNTLSTLYGKLTAKQTLIGKQGQRCPLCRMGALLPITKQFTVTVDESHQKWYCDECDTEWETVLIRKRELK